ncbi:MAG: methyltransferase [Mogibacterium sp.]|nr:methyltransferase [Mogibacterium sp.]
MQRIDDTGFGNIRVIQNPGYGYGVDAVLLAAFAAGETGARGIRSGAKIADLGTDCGIVAFILTHKVRGSVLTGIEKREEAASRAAQAAVMNGLEDRVRIITADVLEISDENTEHEDLRQAFDAVVSNPPYFRKNAAIPSSSEDRYTARHETTADIGGFARAASYMLGTGCSLYLVHRPDRLVDIFTALRDAGLEPKELQLVVPAPGEAANIVLIHAVKGAGPELRLLPEIAVHGRDGGYSEEILRIYERH